MSVQNDVKSGKDTKGRPRDQGIDYNPTTDTTKPGRSRFDKRPKATDIDGAKADGAGSNA